MGLKTLFLAFAMEGALLALGLVFVRRGSPLQRLSGAFGVGAAMFALAAGALAWSQASPRAWKALVFLLVGLAGVESWRSLRGLLRDLEARAVLLGHGAFMCAMLFAQSLVVTYSGAGWAGTWCDPYLNAQSLVDPTLFTLLLALPLKVLGPDFWHYQVAATVLNTLVFFPLASWVRHPRGVFWLTLLLTFNPFVYSQCLWTWPKLWAAYYVLAGADLYGRGARLGAAAFLGAACLTDGLGVPYLVVAAGYTFVVWSPVRVRKALAGTLLFALLASVPLGNLLGNLWSCLVPYPLSGIAHDGQKLGLPAVRDACFLLYAQNLLFAVGLGGLVVFVVWGLPGVVWRHRRLLAPFLAMALPCWLLALGLTPWNQFGTANVNLAPFVLAVLAVNASVLTESASRLKLAVVLALLADTLWGIVLHTWIQGFPPQAWGMEGAAQWNWSLKSFPFLGELTRRASRRVIWVTGALLLLGLVRVARRAPAVTPGPRATWSQLAAWLAEPGNPGQLAGRLLGAGLWATLSSRRALILGFVLVAGLRLLLCVQPLADTSDTYRNLGYAYHLRDAGTSIYTTFARDYKPERWAHAWPDLPYTYPPVTLMFFGLFAFLGLGIFFVKVALTLMDLFVSLVFARQVSPWSGLLYFAGPTSMWLVSREGQFEPLVVLFLTLCILSVQRERWVLAGVCFALALQTKQFALLLTPWLMASLRWRLVPGVRLALGLTLGLVVFLDFYLKAPGLLLFPFRYTQGVAEFNPFYWNFWGPSGWLPRGVFVWYSLSSSAMVLLPLLAWWRSGRSLRSALELLPFTLYWVPLKVARYVQFWYPLASPPYLLCFRQRKTLITCLMVLMFLQGGYAAMRLLQIESGPPESESSLRLSRENHFFVRTLHAPSP